MNVIILEEARDIIQRGLYSEAVSKMDDGLREEIHRQFSPCTKEEFLSAYLVAHLFKYGENFKVE